MYDADRSTIPNPNPLDFAERAPGTKPTTHQAPVRLRRTCCSDRVASPGRSTGTPRFGLPPPPLRMDVTCVQRFVGPVRVASTRYAAKP
jgi:hypothetical protein